jgi:hypothetical protein
LRERAEEQAADVGENGGTARGDAVLGQEFVEVAEGMVDALGGLEVVEIPGEGDVKIGGFLLLLFGTMLGTECGVRAGSGETTLAAGGSAMLAPGREQRGVNSLQFHFGSPWEGEGYPTPGVFAKECGIA